MREATKFLKEVCANCGLTFGAHCAATYHSDFYRRIIPRNFCPGHEGRMDWDKGPGTVFLSSGDYHDISHGTEAKAKTKGDQNS
jgi:hypothetical protein